MEDHSDIIAQVELALAESKRAQRASRSAVQVLANLRDELTAPTAEEAQGNNERADRHT